MNTLKAFISCIYLLCNLNLCTDRQRSITIYRDWAYGNQIAPTRTARFLYYCSVLQIAWEQNSVAAPRAVISPLSGQCWGQVLAAWDSMWRQTALVSCARGGIESVSASTASGLHTAYKDMRPSKVSAPFSKEF